MRVLILLCSLLLPLTPAHAIPEGPEYPSPEWFARDLANVARTADGPAEQATNPDFMRAWQQQSTANFVDWTLRNGSDPSWLLGMNMNTPVTPLCTTWGLQCAGDPYRYPAAPGPDGAPFYENEAEVVPVVFYDEDCARLSGRVWAPREGGNGLPAVVIENGSIQAPEPLYWWAAQLLVRNGYVVLTFDPRGQGRSDQQTPQGEQGSNANSAVFWEGLVNAIDFFRSTPGKPYPHNLSCAGTHPTEVAEFNPHHARIDSERLGLVGHSLGATGVSVVQGYGAEGAAPWPGLLDEDNPVDVIVAWDGLSTPSAEGGGLASVVPRVPAMGQSSEYFFTPLPALSPPDPESHKAAYQGWVDAGLPVYQFTIQGSTHFEWSLLPTFPASSWCADSSSGACEGGWGLPMAEHYTLAWLDRWLKQPGEAGHDSADARLLADADWQERYSFYRRSARHFPTRNGDVQQCADIRAGCDTASGERREWGLTRGGSVDIWLLLVLLFAVPGRARPLRM